MKRIVAISLILILMLSACKKATQVSTPCEHIDVSSQTTKSDKTAAADFAVTLLKNMQNESGTVFSPASVLFTLGILSDGADSETLTEISNTVGMSPDILSSFLKDYKNGLRNSEKTHTSIANSLWINKGKVDVKNEFTDKLDGEIISTEFSEKTKDEINNWISEKTNGMLDASLDKIPDNALLYIINAIAFEGKWEKPFDTKIEREFTMQNGQVIRVPMMSNNESFLISGENEKGFFKNYDGENFGFIAILPGGDISEYLKTLTGEKLLDLINSKVSKNVHVTIPKIRMVSDTSLNDILQNMGIKSAFNDKKADFSQISDDKMFINRFIHKAYINVDENGTEAAASTIVEAANTSMPNEEIINFNKPFIYMVIDNQSLQPIFLGTYMGEEDTNDTPLFTCGNTITRIMTEDENYTFEGGDSVWLSQLLADLEYSPDKLCKCIPMYTVDTEYKTGYGIDLGEKPYARCDKGQADLTPEQAERISQIIQKLKNDDKYSKCYVTE